ncbi:tannase/feruloyl esterase family alpha/beta hydrolase [soil metagenome]
MKYLLLCSTPLAASFLVACGGGGDDAPPQPLSCSAAAAFIATNNTVTGSTLRITKAEDQAATSTVAAHCLVEGALNERVSSIDGKAYAIKFRMRMPLQSAWNGKFFYQSVGGTNGVLETGFGLYSGMTTSAFSRNYAVIVADSGHDNTIINDPAAGGISAFGRDQQARVDFGYNSYDVVTRIGKAIVNAYYAKPQDKSYFLSCSDGGRQAVTIAERFPSYFDGIVAGAPAVDIPHMTAYVPHLIQTLGPLARASGQLDANGRPLMNKVYTDGDLQLASNAIMQACDGLDGLTDGISNNLAACTDAVVVPQLNALTCSGAKTESCLTAGQITALRTAYAGPKNSAGEQVYPGNPWDPGIGGINNGVFNTGFRAYWFGSYASPTNNGTKYTSSASAAAMLWKVPPLALPTADSYIDYFSTYDIGDTERSVTATTAVYNESVASWGMPRLGTLTGFRARGGKLISWIGAADPAVGPQATIDWYNGVNARQGGQASDFLKLFVVPGMNHCGGGPATDKFDMLTALENWVERGTAPDGMTAEATNPAYFGVASRTRPLCAYPKYARYNGTGDVNVAGSFSCQ